MATFAVVSAANAGASTLRQGDGAGDEQESSALVIGDEADSPVLDRLGRKLDLNEVEESEAKSDGPARHDLIVVDGDQHTLRELRGEELLERYAEAAEPVLALDLRSAERELLAEEVGFEAAAAEDAERSALYLFETSVVDGTPTTEIIDSGPINPTGKKVGEKRRRELRKLYSRHLARRAARLVEGELSPPSSESRTAQARASIGPSCTQSCPELQHWAITYQAPNSPRLLPNGNYTGEGRHCYATISCPRPGKQTAEWNFVHDFDVFLINADDPNGDRQLITWGLKGQFTPKRPAEKFFQMFNRFAAHPCIFDCDKWDLERGWWTGYADIGVEPLTAGEQHASGFYPETDSRISWRDSEPSTPNTESSYTVGGDQLNIGVTVGAEPEGPAGGVSASYTVQFPTVTTQIPDWGVENNTSRNHLRWRFSARKRCDVRPDHYRGDKVGFNDPDPASCWEFRNRVPNHPRLPNDLSRSQLPLVAQGRWESEKLIGPNDPDVAFRLLTNVVAADTYCDAGRTAPIACHFSGGTLKRKTAGPETTYGIKFAAGNVVPVGIKSVQVSPTSANGAQRQTVTGKVVLDRAPALPVNVTIYSDSPNAVVGGPHGRGSRRALTIPKGKTEGTFEIKTNVNGIQPGNTTTADITALYGDPETVQLEIQNRP